MTIRVRVDGAIRAVTGMRIMVAGVERRVLTIRTMQGGTVRKIARFADPLSVNVSPASVSGAVSFPDVAPCNTGPVTAQPMGGLAPYAYAWAYLSGYPAEARNPTMASTGFTAELGPGDAASVMRVTVTDAAGQTAQADVQVYFSNRGGNIGGPLQ